MSHVLVVVLFLVHYRPIECDLTKIIDLTWDFSNETIYWPGVTPFSFTKIETGLSPRGYWYAKNEFCAGEHGGTHFDAPYHFNRQGWKVADVPIERLIPKGATINLSANDTAALLPSHLDEWVRVNGEFEVNTVLLVNFGRSRHWPDRTKYMSLDSAGNLNFPGISGEAASWIARSGKIVGVGLDTPSVDPGQSGDFAAHRILTAAQIYVLENVKLVEVLPVKDFVVIALPMKLKGGTGGPVRVFAVPKGLL